MAPLVSVVILVASLYIILSDVYETSHSEWAFGVVGVVIGYWLR